MKVYLALSYASGGGPRVRWSVNAIAPAIAKAVFPIEAGPWHQHAWTSRDGAVQLIGWSNEPDEEDTRFLPVLHADSDAAIGVPGYVGPQTDINRVFDASRLGEADDWSGVFGLFRADQEGFQAITTTNRLHQVYHGAAGNLAVAGNRALLVHAVLRAAAAGHPVAPRYDVAALEPLVRTGYFQGDDTPFEGVKALPAHSTLHARDGRADITTRPLRDARARMGLRDYVEELASALVAASAWIGEFPSVDSEGGRIGKDGITVGLTGGRDSRLVAAAFRAAGVPFNAFTFGFADHPDVVLGARIAALLGVPHRISAPARDDVGTALVQAHPRARAWVALRATEGMISASFNALRSFARFSTPPRLGGHGGEQLRAGFLAKARSLEPDATDALLRKILISGDTFLTDAARQRATRRLAAWSERDPLDALDLIYLYDRSGRWAAGMRSSARFRSNTFDLLFDNRVTRRAMAMPPAVRWSERPIYKTIVRLAPALRNVPLIGRRWCFERGARFWHAGWLARAAVKRPDPEGAGFDWRDALGTPPLGPIFREQILDGPASLFEVVDRDRVEKVLGGGRVGKEHARLLWHVYTASVLLSDDWLGEHPAVEPLSIPVPKRLRRAAG